MKLPNPISPVKGNLLQLSPETCRTLSDAERLVAYHQQQHSQNQYQNQYPNQNQYEASLALQQMASLQAQGMSKAIPYVAPASDPTPPPTPSWFQQELSTWKQVFKVLLHTVWPRENQSE